MRNIIKIVNIDIDNFDTVGMYYTNVLKDPIINVMIRPSLTNSGNASLQYNFDSNDDDWYTAHLIQGVGDVNYGNLQGIYGLRIKPVDEGDTFELLVVEYYLAVSTMMIGN